MSTRALAESQASKLLIIKIYSINKSDYNMNMDESGSEYLATSRWFWLKVTLIVAVLMYAIFAALVRLPLSSIFSLTINLPLVAIGLALYTAQHSAKKLRKVLLRNTMVILATIIIGFFVYSMTTYLLPFLLGLFRLHVEYIAYMFSYALFSPAVLVAAWIIAVKSAKQALPAGNQGNDYSIVIKIISYVSFAPISLWVALQVAETLNKGVSGEDYLSYLLDYIAGLVLFFVLIILLQKGALLIRARSPLVFVFLIAGMFLFSVFLLFTLPPCLACLPFS